MKYYISKNEEPVMKNILKDWINDKDGVLVIPDFTLKKQIFMISMSSGLSLNKDKRDMIIDYNQLVGSTDKMVSHLRGLNLYVLDIIKCLKNELGLNIVAITGME